MSLEVFSDFYGKAFEPVFTAVMAYCGDRDVALEATQEAFARAFSRWRRIARSDSPSAWVTVTAINVSRRHFRRGPDRVPNVSANDLPPSEDRLDVMEAVRGLSPRQREAVILYYLLDCSVAEVADLMDLSEGAVKAHLFKARSALRESLEVRHV